MKLKQYLTKKRIAIICALLAVIIIGLVIFLCCNNTILNSEENNNAKNKVRIKSENGFLKFETTEGTDIANCKVISNTEDIVTLTIYDAGCLCENTYRVGSINDQSEIEEGKDNLLYNLIKGNTTYTISNSFNSGENTTFFFDKDKKFISKTTENTFTTPENARYFKVITAYPAELEMDGYKIEYCLVLGETAGNTFGISPTEVGIDVTKQSEVSIPLEQGKYVMYADGGEVELTF